MQIDLAQKLWLTEIDVVGHPIPGVNQLFANFLRNKIKLFPILPFPVDHNQTDPTKFKSADVRIIDDTSPADKDAAAALVTFGGGTPGDKTAFTQSFISPGGLAGIVVSMGWICRVISPLIDTALNLGGAFTNCHLNHSVRIDDDHEVDLSGLSITAENDGALHVQIKVTKSGFCYSATGTVGAKITIEVVDGQTLTPPKKGQVLVTKVVVDNPTIDVDMSIWCVLAGAVISAALGGWLAGAIGAIVGGVLVPLITFIAEEVIEGVINSVAANITAALNNLLAPGVEIPAVGFTLVFSDVHIDDVQIGCQFRPIDTAPVRATGTVVVPNGWAFDLDSGRVGVRDMPSGDITVLGASFNRTVQAVCGARWARTGLRDFDDLYRAAVYPYSYDAPNPIPLADMATFDPFGLLFGNLFDETLRIYGVRTNEGRWAAIQAVDVTFDHIQFRYITWEKPLVAVQIIGGFTCPPSVFGPLGEVAKPGAAVFVPSPALRAGLGQATPATGAAGTVTGTQPDPCAQLREAVTAMVPAAAAVEGVDTLKQAIQALPLIDQRIGTFMGTVVWLRQPQGRFDAVTSGFGPGQEAKWQLDGTALGGASGQQDLGGGATAHYQIAGTALLLTIDATEPVEMLLSVTVVDEGGRVASAERCVHYDPKCTSQSRLTPPWRDYQSAFLTNFGVVEVPTPTPAPVIR